MGNIEIFEQMAEQYDTDDRIQVAKHISSAIRSHVGDASDKTAMDYGCGTGLVGLELADLFKFILFVDAAEQMVQQVQHKLDAAGLQTASVLCCDLMSDNAPALHVDYLIMAQVLLHIQDVSSILSCLHGLLKNEGHLLIVDFNKNPEISSDKVHNGFEQAELTALCKSAGFASATAETIYHGSNIFMGKDASLFLLDAVK